MKSIKLDIDKLIKLTTTFIKGVVSDSFTITFVKGIVNELSDCIVNGNVSLLGRENCEFKSYQSDILKIFVVNFLTSKGSNSSN